MILEKKKRLCIFSANLRIYLFQAKTSFCLNLIREMLFSHFLGNDEYYHH